MTEQLLKNTLHSFGQGLMVPTLIVLIFLVAVSAVSIGGILTELFTERRKLKGSIPEMLSMMDGKTTPEMEEIISVGGILNRQKTVLRELLSYENLPEEVMRAIAKRLIATEENRYEKIINRTELVARIGPMLGLMGTLIPLGPGLVALGQGDTKTLADSLLVAFDATIAGLVSASVCYVISRIRRRWYDDYLVSMESAMECILEEVYPDEKKSAREKS